jgi:hypothetical protein
VDAEAALEALDHLGLGGDVEGGEPRDLLPVDEPEPAADVRDEPGPAIRELGGDGESGENGADVPEADGQGCRLFPSPRPA